MTDWIYVGKIVNTRGIKGEVKVVSQTDFPEQRFTKGAVLYVHDEKSSAYQPLIVAGYYHHKQFDFLTFDHHHSINEVEKYKGCSLYIPKDQLTELEGGDFYYHQIIGADVITDAGEHLGKVKEILSPGANDVWVVGTEGKDLLLPYIPDVVKAVDTQQNRITVHLIPGLIDDEN